ASLAWLRRRGVVRPGWNGGNGGRERRLEVLDRVALAPQHWLHLVRVDDRVILVGRSPAGITRLAVAERRAGEGGNQ
ncbi:MAG TPA: flagellar biosynthetic protein FliO, partial [Candidatus Omnitrophota bacterium]|nr:flagellar biosynthetic protein FliO [Candidatus Omnitrophota bacterium]